MSISGMEFYVLADHFLIHRSHLYAEKARATEVLFNCRLRAGAEMFLREGTIANFISIFGRSSVCVLYTGLCERVDLIPRWHPVFANCVYSQRYDAWRAITKGKHGV